MELRRKPLRQRSIATIGRRTPRCDFEQMRDESRALLEEVLLLRNLARRARRERGLVAMPGGKLDQLH